MKQSLLGLVTVAMLIGCTDDLDFEKFDSVQMGPNLVVPLVSARLSLADVVADDSIFTVDPDGGLRIIYQNDSLFGFTALEFVEIPDQDPFNVTLATGTPPFALEVGLGTLGGVELATARFFEGDLNWSINTAHNDSVVVEITFANAYLPGSGTPFSFQAVSTGAGLTTGTADIAGLEFDLTQSNQGAPPYNNFNFSFEIIKAKGANPGTLVDLGIQFASMEIDEATGYFGQRDVNVPANSFPMELGSIEQFVNGFYLDNPNIRVDVTNGIGMPLELNLDLDGQNKTGNLQSLNAPAQNIGAAPSPGTIENSVLEWNRNNSNIVDFLANVPNTIIYAGSARINPDGNTGVLNFIDRNSYIQFGLTIDIPFELRTENLRVEEVIDNIDIGEDNPEFLEELELYFTVTNGFPFNTDLEVIFLNSETSTRLDSINLDILQAAAVDGNGRVIAPNIYQTSFELTQSQIDNLLMSDQWIMRARLSTTNNGTQTVKIYTDYDLEVLVGMRTKLNLSTNN